MSITLREIESQPDVWAEAVELHKTVAERLPQGGRRIALIGCGTSYYVAQAVAVTREQRGLGESDAFVASEVPPARPYDAVVAISRSGTTTEVVRALQALAPGVPSLAISAVPDTPVVKAAGDAVLMPFADEESIVQTRFATSALVLLRTHLGDDLTAEIAAARKAIGASLPADPSEFEQFVFLGTGWTVGLAAEAALKFRETSCAWAESYPAMEYRHGPISVAGPGTLVWLIGVDDPALASDIADTGATVVSRPVGGMVELVTIQQAAVALARSRGLDPDRPRHLTRSVVLS